MTAEQIAEIQAEHDWLLSVILGAKLLTKNDEPRVDILSEIGKAYDSAVKLGNALTAAHQRIAELEGAFQWLERIGLSMTDTAGDGPVDAPGVHCWREFLPGVDRWRWRWTARWISSEFETLLDAIRAARKAEGA